MRHWKLIAGTCIALAVAVGGLSVTASAGTAVNTAEAVVAFVESLIIRSQITREWKDLGISKALGFTSGQLIRQIMISNMPAIAIGIAIGLVLSPVSGANLMKAAFSIFGFRKAVFTVLPMSYIITALLISGIAMSTAALLGRRIRTLDPVSMITEE